MFESPGFRTWQEAVLRVREPLVPTETAVIQRLKPLSPIRAVVFDIYGTLLISGSGDVGSADSGGQDERVAEAMQAAGWELSQHQPPAVSQLHEQIRLSNERRVSEQCPKPEVDIVDAWRRTLLGEDDGVEACEQTVRVAAEYEARANPSWPMPGARELLAKLAERGMPLGIVSNAQDFTLPLLEDLQGAPLHQGLFDLDLCVFSYRFRQAKPGPRLFDVLREGLRRRGIEPQEAVYVGNDMLNDVWAASVAGLKTAWFAGDGRSCRPRQDDPRCRSLEPDVVLTDLLALLECLGIK